MIMFAFQCSVVNFPLLTSALKEYASDSAIDLVGMIKKDCDDCGHDNDNDNNNVVITSW